MSKVFNFSAGPAVLPKEVLEVAQKELVNFNNSSLSVMEMSHRSKIYEEIQNTAEKDLRELMNIPNNYKVLFLQGGATLQFSMVPLNLCKNKKAGYIETGVWSKKATEEAVKVLEVVTLASSKDKKFSYIPNLENLEIDTDFDYIHVTSNNTVAGTKISKIPDTKGVPVVADMSSFILSEEINVENYGIIYAGAQKNIGPSGLTIVIIREDLISEVKDIPIMLQYSVMSENGSLYNTPPTFGIYVAGLVFKWLKEKGGVKAIEKINRDKAKLLYDYIDNSSFYSTPVNDENDRSLMNVCFKTPNDDLDSVFAKEAEKNGILNVKGHRSVGGLRASIYNAMPIDGVEYLIEFMEKFKKENK